MDKIKTQDCYFLIEKLLWISEAIADKVQSLPTVQSNHHSELSRCIQKVLEEKFEKHTDMVVLTKEQFEKIILDAFEAGKTYSIDHDITSEFSNFGKLNKTEYLKTILP